MLSRPRQHLCDPVAHITVAQRNAAVAVVQELVVAAVRELGVAAAQELVAAVAREVGQAV